MNPVKNLVRTSIVCILINDKSPLAHMITGFRENRKLGWCYINESNNRDLILRQASDKIESGKK